MTPGRGFDRNVRPAGHDDADEDSIKDREDLSSNEDIEDVGDNADSSEEAESGDEDGSSEDGEDEQAQQQINKVSFGALKKAQDALSRKRKRGSDDNPDQETKLAKLRERLRQIKDDKQPHEKAEKGSSSTALSLRARKAAGAEDDGQETSDEGSGSDSDSAVSVEGTAQARSKHAPAARSSKHQVTRKRQVVNVPKRAVRDPRFDALQQRSAHLGGNSEKAYAFLRDYQKSEIGELRSAMKAAKSEEDREALRRRMNSMENRLKAKEAKEREQEVLRKYRKGEGEKVKQGKNPYFLKRSEVKQRVLVERFEGMKGRDREKVIEKRRVREAQKEKRRMPEARRAVG